LKNPENVEGDVEFEVFEDTTCIPCIEKNYELK
jgi:hypothetical protein